MQYCISTINFNCLDSISRRRYCSNLSKTCIKWRGMYTGQVFAILFTYVFHMFVDRLRVNYQKLGNSECLIKGQPYLFVLNNNGFIVIMFETFLELYTFQIVQISQYSTILVDSDEYKNGSKRVKPSKGISLFLRFDIQIRSIRHVAIYFNSFNVRAPFIQSLFI